MPGFSFYARFTVFALSLSFLLAGALPTAAIVTRHDVDDAKYFKLGAKFRDSICNLNVNPKVPDCMATFLNDRWLITAAHCAEVVVTKMKTGRHEIEFKGVFYEVEKVYLHPRYTDTRSVEDIALIKLKKSVPRVNAVGLLTEPLFMSEPIIVVGYGDFGNGKTGPTGNDAKLRAGTNTIDRASNEWIRFRFDDPASPNVTPLEAISGPGDSGSPALVRRGGKYFIVGISSRQATGATNGKEGLYGVTEFYTRASTYEQWISNTIREGGERKGQ